MKATITATAKYLPQKILSNQELEKMVDTSNEWILSRTGIENRHIVSDGEATSDMCSQIANQLLEKSLYCILVLKDSFDVKECVYHELSRKPS